MRGALYLVYLSRCFMIYMLAIRIFLCLLPNRASPISEVPYFPSSGLSPLGAVSHQYPRMRYYFDQH